MLVTIADFGDSILHPITSFRRLRAPGVPSIVTMGPDELAAYMRRTGIESRLVAVLAEVDPSEDHAEADERLRSGEG